MSSIAKRRTSDIPDSVAWFARRAWGDADEVLNGWRLPSPVATGYALREVLGEHDLSKEERRAIALAWAREALAERSDGTAELWQKVASSGLDALGTASMLAGLFAEVIAPFKDELMPRREQREWLCEVQTLARSLSQLLRESLFDQRPAFLMSGEELGRIGEEVKQQILFQRVPAVSGEEIVCRAMARGFAGDGYQPTPNEVFRQTLEETRIDRQEMRTRMLFLDGTPTLPDLLDRLAQKATPGEYVASEFGLNPRSPRAIRKAFARRVKAVGETGCFWGKPCRPLIRSAVLVLFGEEVAESDLFR